MYSCRAISNKDHSRLIKKLATEGAVRLFNTTEYIDELFDHMNLSGNIKKKQSIGFTADTLALKKFMAILNSSPSPRLPLTEFYEFTKTSDISKSV
jgi:hypothetical protein